MSGLLYRLGRWAAVHPWRTISAWVLVAGRVAGAGAFGGTPQDDYDVPGARAQVGIDQLRDHLPGAGNAAPASWSTTATVADPADAALATYHPPAGMPHVVQVSPPTAPPTATPPSSP